VHQLQPIIKDKGAEKGQNISKGQQTRQAIILAFIRAKLSVSIKDICQLPDAEIKGCSEKTIQRELADLIRQGLIKKVGERRWSQYVPA
jgi:DeoR/GlpR family transcriptional regulator of sugar metabolism